MTQSDLSRFGREYAQMGMYIEHYFEEKGIRFISVAENIDSKNGMDKRITELTKILTKLYEDAALEKISEDRYQAMAPNYEREQAVLKAQREALAAEIAHGEEIYDNIEQFLPIIWKYTNITELNTHILNELIEKIVVHEKVVTPDGIKSQRVDIYYKFIGYVNTRELLNNYIKTVNQAPDGSVPILILPA